MSETKKATSKFPSSREVFLRRWKPFRSQEGFFPVLDDFLQSESERVLLALIPTGGGKTYFAGAMAETWIEATGGHVTAINPTKDLQRNLGEGLRGAHHVMGASEFTCQAREGESCRTARKTCPERAHHGGGGCPYIGHLEAAARAIGQHPVTFTVPSFLAFKERLGRAETSLPTGGLMIVEEGHLLPKILRDALAITIEGKDAADVAPKVIQGNIYVNDEGAAAVLLTREAMVPLQALAERIRVHLEAVRAKRSAVRMDEAFDALYGGGEGAEARLSRAIDGPFGVGGGDGPAKGACGGPSTTRNKKSDTDEDERLETIMRRLHGLDRMLGESRWIATWDESRRRLNIRPTVIPKSFLDGFFQGHEKIVFLSATFPNLRLAELGLVSTAELAEAEANGDDDIQIPGVVRYEGESRIPLPRREIFLDVVHGTHRRGRSIAKDFKSDIDMIIDTIDRKLHGTKGLVHVASMEQARLFAEIGNKAAAEAAGPGGRPRVLFLSPHKMGWAEAFRRYREARTRGAYTLVIVAPARHEGLDLKGDLCRFNILAKAPWKPAGDIFDEVMEAIYPGYREVEILVATIQAMNRGSRGPDDGCLNIVRDLSTVRVLQNQGRILAEWAREAITPTEDEDWLGGWTPCWT